MLDAARFLAAQEGVFDTALTELRSGAKVTHWMWFVFPQLAALGRSPTAKHFGIAGLEDARDYLAHPVLGRRLREATAAMMGQTRGARDVLGPVDAMKLRACATLFLAAGEAPMRAVLARFFDAAPCPLTLAALGLTRL